MEEEEDSRPFLGVHFVLAGFDPINHHEVRSMLVSGGGVDVGSYDPECTHVIVDKLLYDDPICVAARKDRKVLVTGLWVDHSFNIGSPINPTSVLYRPLKGVAGIPGAESLLVCLTGYQGHDRGAIMAMVDLMGAKFSKPLVANKVTHLICYKFEGQKYELATKYQIKLVNHLWLEDCLKAWQLLPEANYNRSGYDLEMEAEAKDSEEEDAPEEHVTSHGEADTKTPSSAKVGSNLVIPSDVTKSTPISYSRKTPSRNTSPFPEEEFRSNSSSFIKVGADKFKVHGGFENSSSREEKIKAGKQTGLLISPSKKESSSLSSGKRKLDLPDDNTESRKIKLDKERCISGSPSKTAIKGSNSAVLISGILDENASPSSRDKSPVNMAADYVSEVKQKSTPKSVSKLQEPRPSSIESENIFSVVERGTANLMDIADNVSTEVAKSERKLQDVQVPSPKGETSELKKSGGAGLDMSKGEGGDSLGKSSRKEVIAKRIWNPGSKLKVGLGKAKNQKGSIQLNDAVVRNVDQEKVEKLPSNAKADKLVMMKGKDIERVEDESKLDDMDDETEAPEDKEDDEFQAVTGEKGEDTDKVNLMMKWKSESTIPCTFIAENNLEGTSYADEDGAKSENEVAHRDIYHNEPATDMGHVHEKPIELKKFPLGKRKSIPSPSGEIKLTERVSREESENVKNNQKMGQKKEKSKPPVTKTKQTPSLKKAENPIDLEKENRPVGSDQRVGQRIAKAASNCKNTTAKIGSKAGITDQSSTLKDLNIKTEPTWFILTGHRLQRKEFQQLIKRLKGRVCRDSHQWSYQATHFICPDPIRRTEKFFAAAASGRWILKTDYLAACNQAGKFLAEEPYEWHKKGLNEDGAINLEAPRRWRLLRERTGHGAFYGMRVIIYGECIAPPLETLKRVIKAGDGTILATSPPYNRFLNSDIDYAIVSPGMPRVDMWVQEFLRHEIPCVAADYLVEYVCKPGYPLERHVQYNTCAWAEKSFAKLQSRSEEIVLEKEMPEDDDDDDDDVDTPCQVCGSRERGEVMLICGDETGALGCGIGTHIDCCEPPLESVPDENWFCSKCNESKNSKSHSKSAKKGKSSVRRK